MNTHFGICEKCGYSTSASKNSGRKCPNGHGELLVLDHGFAKLINKKGDTGTDRLRKLSQLKRQFRLIREEKRIGRRKLIGTGKTFDLMYRFLHPIRVRIK